MPKIKANLLDKAIGFVSPDAGLKRMQARAKTALVQSTTNRTIIKTDADTEQSDGVKASGFTGASNAKLPKYRKDCRNLYKNNTLFRAIINVVTDATVGYGIEVQATSSDIEWNSQAEALWNDYKNSANVAGLPFLETLRAVVTSKNVEGDCIALFLDTGEIQIFPAEHLATPSPLPKGANVIDGIEIDISGKPIAYWIKGLVAGKEIQIRYDAKDCCYISRQRDIGQYRAEPLLAPALQTLQQIDEIVEAKTISERNAACVGLAVYQDGDDASQEEFSFKPGMVYQGKPGDKLEVISGGPLSDGFGDNLMMFARFASVFSGYSLEYILSKFDASYSASKATILQCDRHTEIEQELLINTFLTKWYQWRINLWIKDGTLKAIPDWKSHIFITPKFGSIDPLKEIQAKGLELGLNLITLSEAHKERGSDINAFAERKAQDNAILKAAGIEQIMLQQFTAAPVQTETPA